MTADRWAGQRPTARRCRRRGWRGADLKLAARRLRSRRLLANARGEDRPCGRESESPGRATAFDRGGTDQASISTASPPPWSVEEQDACFVVHDHNGQQLA